MKSDEKKREESARKLVGTKESKADIAIMTGIIPQPTKRSRNSERK